MIGHDLQVHSCPARYDRRINTKNETRLVGAVHVSVDVHKLNTLEQSRVAQSQLDWLTVRLGAAHGRVHPPTQWLSVCLGAARGCSACRLYTWTGQCM